MATRGPERSAVTEKISCPIHSPELPEAGTAAPQLVEIFSKKI
jgi:hypothetical protein